MQVILLNLVLAIISSFVASYIVLTRKYTRARLMAFVILGASIWSYGYAMEMFFTGLEGKLFWANIQFLGMALTNVLPLFIAHFFDKEEWLTKKNIAIVFIVPVLFLGMAITNGFHGAVIRTASINYMDKSAPLVRTYGWATHTFMTYTYLFVGAGLVFALKNAKSYSEENWKILYVLVGIISLPVAYSFYHVFFSTGLSIDYTAAMYNVIAITLALFTPADMRVGSLFPLEYASIVGGMNDIVVITNKADRISYVNPAARDKINQFIGINKDDIVGKKMNQLIQDANINEAETEIEFSGTRFSISYFMLKDWRGRENSVCYILRDLSDRVILENKLETLHLYATKISNAQTMVEVGEVTSNALSKSLGFNNGVLAIFEKNEVSYVKLWGITSEQFQSVISKENTIENILKMGDSQIFPSVDDFLIDVGFGKSQNFKEKTMTYVPIILGGNVIGVLTLFQPRHWTFTEKDQNMLELFGGHIASAIFTIRQNEKLKEVQAAEIKQILEGAGRVSSMVRHDLRGPLQTIRNAAYIVEKNPDNITKMAPIINKSVDYVVKILEDLQYQDQPNHYEKVKLNLNTLIDQALTQLIVPENIIIEKHLCEDPVQHMLDKIKIQRMFDNLFRNAFEAMPQGGVLSIYTRKCLHGTEIRIHDTGIGVEDINKLFRPFHTTKLNGMGLGLVSVKQTVEMHGGFIEVESEFGVGTEFTIRIPQEESKRNEGYKAQHDYHKIEYHPQSSRHA